MVYPDSTLAAVGTRRPHPGRVTGLADERLTIRHDAGGSPEPYVAGTLVAVRRAPEIVGLVRGLDRLLLDTP